MAMTGKERANLRTEAQKLSPLVHVGHAGVTDSIVKTMDEILRTHELVKVDISRNLTAPIREVANALASATGSDVVQVIGRKATLYRDNPDLEWKGNVPPWR
jgi:RNA-binding protein